jgi:recombination protein RecA
MSDATKKLEAAKAATIHKFGAQSAALGSEHYKLNVVPSPSLMLDYKLGIGGMPYGHMVEVFGANQIGKSSVLGYGTLANVQRQNKLPAVILVEPHFDPLWLAKLHGLNPDLLLINRPDNAEEAFDMLRDLVYGELVDYILIDSLGALASQSEAQEEGKKKAFGISGLVTSGLNSIMPRLYKNRQGLMIINQQRQATNTGGNINMLIYDSPGGEALKHHAAIRIHLKKGRERFTAKIDGEDVLVGNELVCTLKKNKLAQAANKGARFNFFNIETEEYGIGIDKASDIINVAKVSGVIEPAGAWLKHPSFPGGKLQGKKALAQYLEEHPEGIEPIRAGVMTKMIENELDTQGKNDVQIEKINGS